MSFSYGMVGITLNRGAIQRWILSQSERSVISRQCMKMAGTDSLEKYCTDTALFDMVHTV